MKFAIRFAVFYIVIYATLSLGIDNKNYAQPAMVGPELVTEMEEMGDYCIDETQYGSLKLASNCWGDVTETAVEYLDTPNLTDDAKVELSFFAATAAYSKGTIDAVLNYKGDAHQALIMCNATNRALEHYTFIRDNEFNLTTDSAIKAKKSVDNGIASMESMGEECIAYAPEIAELVDVEKEMYKWKYIFQEFE